jgi:hypothetical protein
LPAPTDSANVTAPGNQSGQGTARLAAEILMNHDKSFVIPTAAQRRALLVEFTRIGAVIYGKAFDIVKLAANVDLDNPTDVRRNMASIVLYEIKSTNRTNVDEDFHGYFFSMSTAELLVAQSLGERYKFAFVNITTRQKKELSLTQIFARARSIYPSWSIRF